MIIIKLRGGLGNQMFQYAFAKRLALERRTLLILDLSDYNLSIRSFSLDQLNVKYDGNIKNRYVSKIIRTLLSSKSFNDPSPDGSKTSDGNIHGKIYVSGFWESPRHFESIRGIIKEEFALKNESSEFREHASKISNESVSIHVRRGDYLIPHGKYLQPTEYFIEAGSRIIENKRLSNPQIIIFSDDPEWCEQNLNEIKGVKTNIIRDRKLTDVEEMFLMSRCTHNVISNSTFSWWAAFLNKNPEQMVIGPKNWFSDKRTNDIQIKNIMLDSWVLI